jgi:twitching motility protein PilT
MLSESLKGVIAQTLCKKNGGGRIAALEVLLCDSAIGNLIREGKTMQIPSSMQTGKGKGNITLNDALLTLVKAKTVEPKEAYMKAVDKVNFESLLRRENLDVSFITPSVNAPPPSAAGAAAK